MCLINSITKPGSIYQHTFALMIISFFFFSTERSSAQNLATNPSFEAAPWADANAGSADWNSGPTNVFGTENARTGVKYMGISMGRSPLAGSDFREYVKTPLTAALVPSLTYEVSVWVSLSENYGDYACNKIGFVTTGVSPFYAFSNAPIPLTPVYATPSVITNKVGWTQASGTFVASSADTWLTIGNFNTQATSSWVYVGPGTSFYYGYYYLDDACIGLPGTCGLVLPVELLSFEGKLNDKVVDLNWVTATELKCDHFMLERSKDGVTFEEIARVQGHGTSNEKNHYGYSDAQPFFGITSYYRLREVDLDGSKHFSNMVAISPKGIMNLQMNIYPTPAEKVVTIDLNTDSDAGMLQIISSTGKLVSEYSVNGAEKIELNDLVAGSYMALLRAANGQMIKKKFLVLDIQ